MEGNGPGDWLMKLEARIYPYENGTAVQMEMARQPETGRMNGQALTRLADGHYTMAVVDVIIDPTCGLPTNGRLSITDPAGKTAFADFTDTSCEAPAVKVTRQGATERWPLFESP